MRRARARTLLRALAVLASCVLGLGLPRALIVCEGADGRSHVEIRHTEGSCCHEDLGVGAEAVAHAHGDEDDGDATAWRANGGCEHTDFAFEVAPPPPHDVTSAPPPIVAWLAPAFSGDDRQGRAGRRPPATGPPRPDALTLRRATTLLLL